MKRRLARKENKIKKERKNWLSHFAKYLYFALTVGLIFLFLIFFTKNWNGSDKFSVVTQSGNGDVEIVVLDPKLNELTTLVIPGDTEVNVANNLGKLQIKNVWQLGKNEKVSGKLLTSTITKNFSFPVSMWSKVNPKDIKFVFSPGENNISLADRIRAYTFLLTRQSLNKTEINFGKSQFLKFTKLADGTRGHVISGEISERLSVYFSDNYMVDKNLKIYIKDNSGVYGVSDLFGKTLEVMGGKVVAIDKGSVDKNLDCTVSGSDKVLTSKIVNFFGCKYVSNKTTFDLEITLGKVFGDRF